MSAEILAPAGNMESLQAAVAAGADAVYFALPMFGARAFAKNFSLEQTREIIQKAHLEGVKVYITMNTLLSEKDMDKAFEWANELYKMGVDALIIQDLGLMHLLHERLPMLELHASTQVSVIKVWQIEKLKELGVSRVVLAREASMEEVEACREAGVELEVFVHGALCISYSGQCQFSQVRYGRSGNKGACAQPCRMEYTLLENDQPVKTSGSFLLSPKDLSVLSDIPKLEKAGVASLKIEGRMKSPSYVYEAVSMARKAQRKEKLTQQDLEDLKVTFNRGYTKGHLFGQKGKDLMNMHTSNHQGIDAGEVIGFKNGRALIRLSRDVHQEDGLRFEDAREPFGLRLNFLYDEKGKLVSSAKAGEIIQVQTPKKVYPKTRVKKTVDFLMEKNTQRAIDKTRRQSDISFRVICEGPGFPVILEATDGKYKAIVEGGLAQSPLNRPTSEEDFIKQLSKTGNTWAHTADVTFDLSQEIFVPLKDINKLRNQAIDQLADLKLKVFAMEPRDYQVILEQPEPLESYIEIMKKEQNQDYGLPVVSEFPFENTKFKAGLKDQQGYVSAHLGKAQIVEGMNITNSYALAALLKMGYQGAVLSDELTNEERRDLMAAFKERYGFDAPVIANVYEHPRLMVMNHCPVNTVVKDGKRNNCSLCRKNKYELEGKDGKKALLFGTKDCSMRLFDEQVIDKIEDIQELKKEGIQAFRLAFLDESPAECKAIAARFLQAAQKA